MRLAELEARFIKWTPDGWDTGPAGQAAQHGVLMLCPKCFRDKGSSVGVHSILCWFVNPREGDPVGLDEKPGPGRWARIGETIETLTLGPPPGKSDSILIDRDGCGAHFFIRNGEIQFT